MCKSASTSLLRFMKCRFTCGCSATISPNDYDISGLTYRISRDRGTAGRRGRPISIHPFRDFNDRVGRMFLVALLHLLGLPVEIVPAGPEFRQAYLEALDAADRGDYGRLTEMWLRRLAETL